MEKTPNDIETYNRYHQEVIDMTDFVPAHKPGYIPDPHRRRRAWARRIQASDISGLSSGVTTSLAVEGDTPMTGAIELVEGEGIILSQDTPGKQISISSDATPTSAFGELFFNGAVCGDTSTQPLICGACALNFSAIQNLSENTSTGVTLAGLAGTITLDTHGLYIVHVSMTEAHDHQSGNVFGNVFQNGAPSHIVFGGRETSSYLQSYHAHGLITSIAGDVLDVRLSLEDAPDTVSIYQINFSVHLLLEAP